MAHENRAMKEYSMPRLQDIQTSIARPNVEANNFELKPSLIGMVQADQFGGETFENPNSHLKNFLEISDTSS